MERAWVETPEAVLRHFGSSAENGLTEDQVKKATQVYGPNELEEEEATPLWELILEQFQDKLVLILLGSAIVSLVLALVESNGSIADALVEPMVIFLILTANATVGVLQERNADQSIQALRAYAPEQTVVIRGGQPSRISASALVPGDIVVLATGDRVPADCRLVLCLLYTSPSPRD